MKKERILIVEDEELVAELIARTLDGLGYTPLAMASTANEAISLAERLQPDLVLMDVNLAGGFDGISAAATIRERFGIRSVFTTALEIGEVLPRAKQALPVGYLHKPFNPARMHSTIEMARYTRDTRTQLDQQRTTLEAILQVMPDGVLVTDVDGQILEANEAACRLTGRSRAELTGLTVLEVICELGSPEEAYTFARKLAERATHQVCSRPDQAGRVVEVSVSEGASLGADRFVCFVRDVTERSRATAALRDSEENLRSSEQRLRLALEAGGLGAFEHTVCDDRMVVSEQFCRIVGLPVQATILAAEWTARVHPDDRPRVSAALNRLLEEHISLDLEFRHARPAGDLQWVRATAVPVVEDRQVVRIHGVVQDITARKSSESRLRRLSRAVEQSPASILITDLDGRIEYVNPAFCAVTGYSLAEVQGENPRFLKSGEMPAGAYRQMWAAITAGETWRGEFHNRRKDGTLYWESASISPIRDEQGKVTHFVGVKEDITQQKQAARELELRQSYLTALIENQPGPVWLKDSEGRVLAVNQLYAQCFGYKEPTAAVGSTIRDLWPAAVADALRRSDEQVRDAGSTRFCLELPQAGGGSHWVEIYKSLARDATGQTIGITGFCRDITFDKRAEAELLASSRKLEQANVALQAGIERERELTHAANTANRAKTAFLASMSHELRTPLNVINGVSATQLRDSSDPRSTHAAGLILECGQHLLRIIEEILDYSVLQADRAKPDPTPFDLLEVVSAALRQAAVTAAEKQIDLTHWIDPATPTMIRSDRRRLQQILLNLLQNALKFTARGGVHLRVSAQPLGAGAWRWSFAVFDSGIGISPDGIGRLFEPFTQANPTIARTHGGTGLGLAISRSFARMLGGDLTVRSRSGHGSCFLCTIVAPEVGPERRTIADLRPRIPSDRPIRVIAAKSRRRRLLVALLKAWGFQPEVFSGASWVESAAGRTPLPALSIVERTELADRSAALEPLIWLERGGRTAPSDGDAAPSLSAHLDIAELRDGLARAAAGTGKRSAAADVAGSGTERKRLADRLPLRILAADDISTNRAVLAMMLQNFGYEAELVTNGAEAVAALQSARFDLVLLDIQMPVMDGLTAARTIVRRHPNRAGRPRMVALTANALEGDREKCLAAGMDDYLAKPILPDALEACIVRVFQGSTRPAARGSQPATVGSPALLDREHLVASVSGLPDSRRPEFLRQMQEAVTRDAGALLGRLSEACSAEDPRALADTLHAMKGCFLTIGWKRLAGRCAEALATARQGSFTGWAELPATLQRTYTESNEAMTAYLAEFSNDAPLPTRNP